MLALDLARSGHAQMSMDIVVHLVGRTLAHAVVTSFVTLEENVSERPHAGHEGGGRGLGLSVQFGRRRIAWFACMHANHACMHALPFAFMFRTVSFMWMYLGNMDILSVFLTF